MAKKDDKLEDIDLDAVVEDENPDETDEQEDTEGQETDDQAEEESTDEETDDDSEESEDEETEAEAFEKRFPRFKGETLEEYVKNLEEGYANSSSEGARLARELKELKDQKLSQIANQDAEEDLPSPPEKKDPALAWAESQREEAWKNDWNDFVKIHPELDQDESLFVDFDKKTGDMMEFIIKTENRYPTLKEAMQKAWNYMNPESVSKDERVAMAAKNAGAGTKSKGVSKDKPKPLFTDEQIEWAKRADPTLADKSRAEVEKILAKYQNV